jgi:hypothetical protein
MIFSGSNNCINDFLLNYGHVYIELIKYVGAGLTPNTAIALNDSMQ